MSTATQDGFRQQVLDAGRPAAQIWPLKTFAYRNPVRGYESLPFDTAVRQAGRVIGGQGYLPNSEYRAFHRAGRITSQSLFEALRRLGPAVDGPDVTVAGQPVAAEAVLWLHLTEGIAATDPSVLHWTAREEGLEDLLRSVEDLEARVQQASATRAAAPELPIGRTLSDWLEALTGSVLVEALNEQAIKWSAAFLDEGMAGWGMPSRSRGFYASWRELAASDRSMRFLGIRDAARKIAALPESAEDAVRQGLDRLGIPAERRTEYQERMFAQLPGWAGFVRWRSENPTYPAQREHPIDPVEYLAVRMFYEVELVDRTCRQELGVPGTLEAVRNRFHGQEDSSRPGSAAQDVKGLLFNLAQGMELTPEEVTDISTDDARTLLGWVESFPEDRHGEIWLAAYEACYRERLVSRLAGHRGRGLAVEGRPHAQLIFCIDARSEPFRRHLEQQGPYETFGYAGFFGVPISHQAFDSHDRLALCPVLLKPGRSADEGVREDEEPRLLRYASGTRWRRLGDDLFHDLKQNPLGAFMLVDALGFLFSVGLAGKTLIHRPYTRLRNWIRGRFASAVTTRVAVGQEDSAGELPAGFSLAEQTAFIEGGLRMIGLTDRLARLVVVCGHGAESDNNPYAAAYNCGACGGAHGDPNARAFTAMANDPTVRQAMRENGLDIPDDVRFVAGKHDTTTDRVSFYDLVDLPESHADDLKRLQADLEAAGAYQAAERLGNLPGTPLGMSPPRAARHAEGRSFDWANPRPEWGLSSNAAFLIGRRWLTKGLDLESRVFLHSYDPTTDPDGGILEKIMTAPLIVGEWINTEYYFSAVDPWVYGSGSKVLHNVVGGVGVMLGSQSDLQGGLPLQGVADGPRKYHEPMRLLAVIEAPTERIGAIIDKHGVLQDLFHNQWVNLLALDPHSGQFHRYDPSATWELLQPGVAA